MCLYPSKIDVFCLCEERSDEAISTFGEVIGLKVMRLLRFARNDECNPFSYLMVRPDEIGAWGIHPESTSRNESLNR